MAVELRDPYGVIEKVNTLRFNGVGPEQNVANFATVPEKDVYFDDVLTISDVLLDLNGVPVWYRRRRNTPRSVSDAGWTSGQRVVHSENANFTSADLGKTFIHANFKSGLFPTRIVTILAENEVEVDVTASATSSNQTITIQYRQVVETFDNGYGQYSSNLFGTSKVQMEHTGQTGDLHTWLDAYGVRKAGIPIATPSVATDVVTKGYTDAQYPNVCQIELYDSATDVVNGNQMTRLGIPPALNGFNLVAAGMFCEVTPATSAVVCQVQRARKATPTTWVNMLTVGKELMIDVGDYDSVDAATQYEINTGNDDVATGDRVTLTVTGTYTAAKGLWVRLTWAKP